MKPWRGGIAGARRGIALLLAALLLPLPGAVAHAAGGPLGIDHEQPYGATGIWSRRNQKVLEFGVPLLEVGGALWLGNDDPLGHVFWQSLDASVSSGIAGQALKFSFSRARPNQGNDPDRWFRGRCCQSFPSGEVTLQASFVTPFIIDYGAQHPWVWGLELLPAWDAEARLRSQAHWQSDVLAGWALGTAAGWWATTLKTPLTVRVLPRGLSVGYASRF